MGGKPRLTGNQEAFCLEYLKDRNGTRAAERAGYAPGSGAAVEASKLLRLPKIRDRLHQLTNAQVKTRGLKRQTVINRLDDLSSCDPADAFDENGHYLPIHDIPADVRRCIKKVTVRAEWDGSGPDKTQIAEITVIEFHDRNKANEILSKYLKIIDGDDDPTKRLANSLEALVAGANPRTRDVSPKQITDGEDETDEDSRPEGT